MACIALAVSTVGLAAAPASADTAQAWGYGGNGQLGNGSTASSNVPVFVTNLSTDVVAVAGGELPQPGDPKRCSQGVGI
jgi:hypothetical protein